MTIHTPSMPWTPPVQRAAQEPARRPAAPVVCPVCGWHNTLSALGERIDHPYRWRRWATMVTDLYLCDRCDALVEVGATTGTTHRECRRAVAGTVDSHKGTKPSWSPWE